MIEEQFSTDPLPHASPSQEHVHKYNLVDAFVKNNIGMILNLQEVCIPLSLN